MLKIITQVSRFIIGIVFVYSGFVKLVDPIGTKIKMIEYFGENVLNLEFLIPFALPVSILLILAELILGLMLLLGYKPKFTVYSIFALSTVFLFLTWYSHKYQVVTDCGCFGDAITLTTAETFYKNIFFTALIIILIFGLKYIKLLFPEKTTSLITFFAVGLSGVIAFYVLNHLPIIDFRNYAVGTDIVDAMITKEGEEVAKIHDFIIETEKGDQLQEALKVDKLMLVIMNDIETADKSTFPELKKLATEAETKGYLVYFVTDTPPQYLPKTPKELGLPFKFAACDVKTMKTAIRANPGVMTIEKGVIIGKWNGGDANDVELK